MGGLGNQMFQYAFGRSITLRNNLILKLDNFSGFENDFYKRKYSLGCFNIVENLISRKEADYLKRLESFNSVERFVRAINPLSPYYRCIKANEGNFNFGSIRLKFYKKIYIEGYWQGEQYFSDIAKNVREEFVVKPPANSINLKIADEIVKTNSVCIHIRRYKDIPKGIKRLSPLPVNYYCEAMKYLSNVFSDLHFFIFSDDHEWARENIKTPSPIRFITHNKRGYEDFRLMSLCRHHIIANSTFSWWAAWLNSNPKKIVIAPKKWFSDSKKDSKNLIPKKWVSI
jgi:hypothetical protein